MKNAVCLLAIAALTFSFAADISAADKEEKTPAVLDFKMKTLDGKDVKLSDYKGKVILMVNVASRCGRTPQYAPLQAMYEKHKDDGLVILGFPCNQFGKQEPGSAADIRSFCTDNYGVTFPMFAKIDVNGENAAPLYKFLTSKETNPEYSGKIGWNFEKFLISKEGEVVKRFKSGTSPESKDFIAAVKAELAK